MNHQGGRAGAGGPAMAAMRRGSAHASNNNAAGFSAQRFGGYQGFQRQRPNRFRTQAEMVAEQQALIYERYYYEREFIKMMSNLRTQFIPQIEQMIAYWLIPTIGAWLLRKCGFTVPTLPTVVGISFCQICRYPKHLGWSISSFLSL